MSETPTPDMPDQTTADPDEAPQAEPEAPAESADSDSSAEPETGRRPDFVADEAATEASEADGE